MGNSSACLCNEASVAHPYYTESIESVKAKVAFAKKFLTEKEPVQSRALILLKHWAWRLISYSLVLHTRWLIVQFILPYTQSKTQPCAHSSLHNANFPTFVFETDWKPNIMHSDFSSWSLRLVPPSSPLPIVYWQHPSSAHQLIQKMRNEKRTRGQRKPSWKSAFGGINSGNPLPSIDVWSSSETTRRFPNSFYSNHTSYIASDGWEWPPNPILHPAFTWLVQKILLLNSPITYSYQLSLIEAWVYIWVPLITLWRKPRWLNPCHTREIHTVSTLLSLPTTQIMRADVHLSETF